MHPSVRHSCGGKFNELNCLDSFGLVKFSRLQSQPKQHGHGPQREERKCLYAALDRRMQQPGGARLCSMCLVYFLHLLCRCAPGAFDQIPEASGNHKKRWRSRGSELHVFHNPHHADLGCCPGLTFSRSSCCTMKCPYLIDHIQQINIYIYI